MFFGGGAGPNFALNDFGLGKKELHHPRGWVALSECGVACLQGREVRGFFIPGSFEGFTQAGHVDVHAGMIAGSVALRRWSMGGEGCNCLARRYTALRGTRGRRVLIMEASIGRMMAWFI